MSAKLQPFKPFSSNLNSAVYKTEDNTRTIIEFKRTKAINLIENDKSTKITKKQFKELLKIK